MIRTLIGKGELDVIRKKKERKPQEQLNLSRAWEISKSWKRGAIIWRFLDHFFAVGAFAFSIAVVYLSAGNGDNNFLIIFFSSSAAILTLMGFALNSTQYMSSYRTAFELLNSALTKNTDENGVFKCGTDAWNEVVLTVKRGEQIIGKTFNTGGDS